MIDTNQNSELRKLIVDNLAETKMLREEIISVRRFMKTRTIISIIWIIVVLLPTILAIFYIPALFKDVTGNNKDILNLLQGLM